MSEFGGLRKHEKTLHALVGLGSALAAAVVLPRPPPPPLVPRTPSPPHLSVGLGSAALAAAVVLPR